MFAADLPKVRPEMVGLSTERLGRIGEVMQQYVDEGRLGGVVTLVARDGKVAYLQAFGKLDPATGAAMPTDAIFRIASQTKALTSVAVMMLFEEGKILLGDPVSKFIPEFKKTTVAVPDGVEKRAGLQDRPGEAADHHPRPPDPHGRHLLRRRPGQGPLQGGRDSRAGTSPTVTEPVGGYRRELAALPMDAQPGEKYVYGYNTDILGLVVEVVSGMTLAEFVQKRITGPLGLADTQFYLPEEKDGRLSAVYGGKDGQAELAPTRRSTTTSTGRGLFAGGAGLLSTAADYGRFLQMLLNGGELDGVRILSPKTVELMTANHVGHLYGERDRASASASR